MNSKTARAALLSAAGAAALLWVAKSIQWDDIWTPAQRLNAPRLALGLALYLLFAALKALRFAAFLNAPADRTLYGVVCAQTFWSNLLPMRLGDLSYIPLLKNRAGEPLDKAAASFLLAALADLWTRLALAAALGAVLYAQTGSAQLAGLAALAAAGCAVSAAALPLVKANWIPSKPKRLQRALSQLQRELRRQTSRAALVRGLLYSAGALAARFAFLLYLLRVMFPGVSAAQGLFAMTFTGLVNLLPIQGVAGVGAVELPWAWAMSLAGAPSSQAAASALALHAVTLLYACAAGLLSLALLPKLKTA